MKVLALDTSTACGSVAVFSDGKILAFEKLISARAHAEFINPASERCLEAAQIKISEIDLFACGLGPGSFTGLRVSGNIAKTFAMTFQKPLVAVDSLTLLKENALEKKQFPGNSFLCLINAFKNMLYVAHFLGEEMRIAPTAMTLPQIVSLVESLTEPTLGLGDGFSAYAHLLPTSFQNKIIRDSSFSDYPLASTLALKAEQLALQGQTMDWKSYKPLYIRASAAEENLTLKN